jgi:hypothetical protein
LLDVSGDFDQRQFIRLDAGFQFIHGRASSMLLRPDQPPPLVHAQRHAARREMRDQSGVCRGRRVTLGYSTTIVTDHNSPCRNMTAFIDIRTELKGLLA